MLEQLRLCLFKLYVLGHLTSEDDVAIVRELVPSLETVVKRDEASDTGTVNVLSRTEAKGNVSRFVKIPLFFHFLSLSFSSCSL